MYSKSIKSIHSNDNYLIQILNSRKKRKNNEGLRGIPRVFQLTFYCLK